MRDFFGSMGFSFVILIISTAILPILFARYGATKIREKERALKAAEEREAKEKKAAERAALIEAGVPVEAEEDEWAFKKPLDPEKVGLALEFDLPLDIGGDDGDRDADAKKGPADEEDEELNGWFWNS